MVYVQCKLYRRSQYIPMLTHLLVVVTLGTKIGDLE